MKNPNSPSAKGALSRMSLPHSADPAGTGTRSFLVACLYSLGVINGVTDKVVNGIATGGFLTALMNTFGVSLIVIVAAVIGLKLAVRTPDRAIDNWDRLAGTLYLLGLCVPRSYASMAALTFFAAYEGIRSRRSAEAVAAASLFIGITACQLWGRAVLEFFALPILGVDATLVAGVLKLLQGGDVEHVGNLVNTVQGQSLVILPGCSSLSNISYALLCWMAMVRAYRPSWRKTDLAMVPVVVSGVILLNVLRMALMGVSRQLYFFIHSPAGADVTNSLILIVAITAAWRTLAHTRVPGQRCVADTKP